MKTPETISDYIKNEPADIQTWLKPWRGKKPLDFIKRLATPFKRKYLVYEICDPGAPTFCGMTIFSRQSRSAFRKSPASRLFGYFLRASAGERLPK